MICRGNSNRRVQSLGTWFLSPKRLSPSLEPGLDGVIDSLQAAQHALEMFRRSLPIGAARRCLERLSNRLTKITTEARKLHTP